MALFTDNFTATAGTALESSPSAVGGTWIKNSAFTGGLIISPSGVIRTSTGTPAGYYASAVPPSNEYSVTWVWVIPSGGISDTNAIFKLILRGSTNADTGYYFAYGGGSYYLIQQIAGGQTIMTSGALSGAAGTSHTIVFSVKNTTDGNNNPALTATMDGNPIFTGWVDGRSNKITAVGRAGVIMQDASTDTTQLQLGSFQLISGLSATATPTKLQKNSTGQTVTITGASTAWTSGTTFSVSGGTGSSITAQSINVSTQVATLTVNAGSANGTLTFANSTDSFTTTVTVATYFPFTYTPTQLWDNSYTGTFAINTGNYYRSSEFARAVHVTNAASVDVSVYLDQTGQSIQQFGMRIDGAETVYTVPTAGLNTINVALPNDGSNHTVEIVSGQQVLVGGSGPLVGTWLVGATFNGGTGATLSAVAETNLAVVVGDSIASSGGPATTNIYQGWTLKFRDSYAGNTLVDAICASSLYMLCSGGVTGYANQQIATGAKIFLFVIGTNDYGLAKQTASAFGTMQGQLFDAIHAGLPNAIIYTQTLCPRNDNPTGTLSTFAAYNAAITSVAASRSFTHLLDGSKALPAVDLSTDLLHPGIIGHADIAGYELGAVSNAAGATSGGGQSIVSGTVASFTAPGSSVSGSRAAFAGSSSTPTAGTLASFR